MDVLVLQDAVRVGPGDGWYDACLGADIPPWAMFVTLF